VPDETENPSADESGGDAVFEALWKRVLEAWDDDKPHQALLEYALGAERLPDAAGRYRALKDDPAKAERAQKKLDGIVAAATQMLFALKAPEPKNVKWPITLIAALVAGGLLAYLVYAVLARR
jgi:hypothetical protein